MTDHEPTATAATRSSRRRSARSRSSPSADALREVRFPNGRPVGPEDGPDEPDHPVLADAARQLREYFAGDRTSSTCRSTRAAPVPAVGVAGADDDPVRRDRQLRRAGPPPRSRRQGPGDRRRQRQQPDPVILPCHRVIGSDGSLTGFGGGLETKAWLLHHERQVAGIELPL